MMEVSSNQEKAALKAQRGSGEITLHHDETGATLLETALTLPLFFAIVLTFVDLLLYLFQASMTQYAVDRAIREVVPNGLVSVATIRERVKQEAEDVGRIFKISDEDIRVCSGFNETCASESRGTSEGFFTVSVKSNFRGLFFPFAIPLQATGFARNEPFL